MKNMKKIFKQLSLLLVLAYLHLKAGNSELIAIPRNTEVLVNHSTYFNCSTSIRSEQIHWYHYRVGENKTNYVYYKGQFNKDYADRYSIAIDTGTEEYSLIIRTVQPGDGGRYTCQDDGGLGGLSSAELIVLDSRPVCKSNMKQDGLVGPNSCGLPIDELQLSCSVSYSGNIHPILQWKMEGDDTPILKGITIDYSGKRATMNMTMSSGVEMDRASFTCTTTRTHDKQCSCTSGQVKVNYAVNEPTILNITKGETVTCSANVSVPCIYRWFNGNDSLCPASCNEIITTNRLQDHSCEASCTINGISCTFVAMRIFVFENETSLVGCPLCADDQICKPYRDAIICIFVIILPTLIAGSLFVFWYLRVYRPKKQKANKEKAAKGNIANISESLQEETDKLMSTTDESATKLKELEKGNGEQALGIKVLENDVIREHNEVVDQTQKLSEEIKTDEHNGRPDRNEASYNEISQLKARVKDLEQRIYLSANINYADKPTCDRTIITDAHRGQNRPINSMTILGRELFVLHDNNSVVDVFDADEFQFVRSWKIEGMLHPMDIASCKIANCLYIIHREDNKPESQIMKLEPKGKLIIKKWSTGGDNGRLSTYESNVIACHFEKCIINEYSGDGSLIHTVRLSPGDGFNHPWHAIKVTSSHFAVCHGDAKDELHRVCIVDIQGNIIKAFREWEVTVKNTKLNVPICIVEDSERSILIADRDDHSIRLINCLLNHQRTLIKKETEFGLDGYPVRICLDETKGRLLVAVNTLLSNGKEWKDGRILVFKIISR